MRTCELHKLMLDLASERRETGRPLGRGDLIRWPTMFREVIRAGSAGECMEAKVEEDILEVRSERRPAQEE